jgi:oligoendopeptidase F
MAGFLKGFLIGRAEVRAEIAQYGSPQPAVARPARPNPAPPPWPAQPPNNPAGATPPYGEPLGPRAAEFEATLREYESNKRLLAELVSEAEKLQAYATGLKAERDENERALTDLMGYAEQLQARVAEGEENKLLIVELAELVTQLQARADVLEAELKALPASAEVLAEALRLPGVRDMLLKKFHPDLNQANGDEAASRALTEAMQKINAAYALIRRVSKNSN